MRFALARFLLPLLALYPLTPSDDRPTAEILEEVLEKQDGCDVRALFGELGSRGDRDSFEAITEGLAVLEEVTNRVVGYRALRHFVGADPKLERRVITWLDQDLRKRGTGTTILPATALAQFGGAAERELREQLGRHTDRAVRASLVEGLLETLGEKDSPKSLELILANHRPSVGKTDDLERILGRLYDPSRSRLALRELTDGRRLAIFRVAFVEVFGRVPGKAADDLLGDLLLEGEEEIGVAAAEALAGREGAGVEALLARGAKNASGAAVRGAALRGLLARTRTSEQALQDLVRHGGSKNVGDRIEAAHGLGGSGGPVELLCALLDDSDSSVRSAALAASLSRRDKQVLPFLIERLELEPGQRAEVQRVLRLLTGEDFGGRPQRWRTWWKAQGDDLELPSRSKARAQFQDHVAKAQREQRDSFYGLPIRGEGIYFLLDASDSMSSIYQLRRSAKEPGVTLFDVLGEEVSGALRRMKEGQRFNLIFFGTQLERFAPKLVTLDGPTKERASAWAEGIETLGSTNLRAAFKAAFEDSKMDAIYLVTDGSSGRLRETDKLLNDVRKWNRRRGVRIHAVDIGFVAAHKEFSPLFQLTERTGGTYRHVPPAILAGK